MLSALARKIPACRRTARTWLPLAAGLAALLVAAPAGAGTLSFSGTSGATPISGSSSSLGALMLPANVTFSDVLTPNTNPAPATTVDDWTFNIPASVFGGTVTGD